MKPTRFSQVSTQTLAAAALVAVVLVFARAAGADVFSDTAVQWPAMDTLARRIGPLPDVERSRLIGPLASPHEPYLAASRTVTVSVGYDRSVFDRAAAGQDRVAMDRLVLHFESALRDDVTVTMHLPWYVSAGRDDQVARRTGVGDLGFGFAWWATRGTRGRLDIGLGTSFSMKMASSSLDDLGRERGPGTGSALFMLDLLKIAYAVPGAPGLRLHGRFTETVDFDDSRELGSSFYLCGLVKSWGASPQSLAVWLDGSLVDPAAGSSSIQLRPGIAATRQGAGVSWTVALEGRLRVDKTRSVPPWSVSATVGTSFGSAGPAR